MTTLTPEEIEGISAQDILKVKNLAAELHQNTTGILNTPFSSADIKRFMELRTALKLKIDESMGYIKGMIADYDALSRELRTIKGWQSSDLDRLESLFFSTLREEEKKNA
jgi:hypothetical protein